MRAVSAAWFAAVAVTVLIVSGCTSSGETESRPLVMGSDGTSRMDVVAEIYGGALRGAGVEVSATPRTGTDHELLDDMDAAEVDLFGAFTGRLLAQLAPNLTPATPDEVYNDLNRSLPQGVSVGDRTPVSDVPKLFVAASLAESSGATDLSGCARLTQDLPVVTVSAADDAALGAFTEAGCRSGAVEIAPSVQDVLARVASGQALGVLSAFDAVPPGQGGEDAAAAVTALAPTEGSPGPRAQDLVPVYRSAALDKGAVKAINKVAGELTTADLAVMAREVDGGADARAVAGRWLAEHGI